MKPIRIVILDGSLYCLEASSYDFAITWHRLAEPMKEKKGETLSWPTGWGYCRVEIEKGIGQVRRRRRGGRGKGDHDFRAKVGEKEGEGRKRWWAQSVKSQGISKVVG